MRSRLVHRRQRGQTLIVFALGFALFLFSLTCLVADSAYLYVWSGRVQDAAQLGAQSGADSVNPSYLYGVTGPCPNPSTNVVCTPPIVDITAQDREGSLYAFQRSCIQTSDQSAQIPRDPSNPLVLLCAPATDATCTQSSRGSCSCRSRCRDSPAVSLCEASDMQRQ
jgi:hypothetical protein